MPRRRRSGWRVFGITGIERKSWSSVMITTTFGRSAGAFAAALAGIAAATSAAAISPVIRCHEIGTPPTVAGY